MYHLTDEAILYRKIVECLKEGILLLDSKRRVIFANEAARMSGICDAGICITPNIMDEIADQVFHQFIDRLYDHGEPIETTIIRNNAGESELYLHLYGCSFLDSLFEERQVLIVMTDVTPLHKLERIRRDFVSNVSHELRTPITSIKASVETLLDGAIDSIEDAKRFTQIISRHADRLLTIVEDLLKLTRLEVENEYRDLDKVSCKLSPVLESVRELCSDRAEKMGIKIDISCSPDIVVPLHASLFNQAILNLVDNAIKSSDDGDVVSINCSIFNNKLVIEIIDAGCGISEVHLNRVFERFYRVDSGRGRAQGGTGIGLALVKHIIQAHSGNVKVSSKLNVGTTFTVILPL
jgi:two-component system, OmpR family, phosphate regulon sensor histidine kinase PhoR